MEAPACVVSQWLASGINMSAGIAVPLYVSPHQHKYLVGKMSDPDRLLRSPYGLFARTQMEAILQHPLLRVGPGGARNEVVLLVRAPDEFALSGRQRKRLNGLVSALMARELTETVLFYRNTLRVGTQESIFSFLAQYGIDTEDWSYDAAHECLKRYRRRLAKRSFRGDDPAGVSAP